MTDVAVNFERFLLRLGIQPKSRTSTGCLTLCPFQLLAIKPVLGYLGKVTPLEDKSKGVYIVPFKETRCPPSLQQQYLPVTS